jgi:hypothetical protein
VTRRDVCRKCVEAQRQKWLNDSAHGLYPKRINTVFDKELRWIDEDRCPLHHRADERMPVQEMIDRWPNRCFFVLELVVAEKT